jgi:hypothetical protein
MECTSLYKFERIVSLKQKFVTFVNTVPLDRDAESNFSDTFVKIKEGAYL